MENPDCLKVTCSPTSIKALFRADLFHTNLENESTFIEQLSSGHRVLVARDNENARIVPKGSRCGFKVTDSGVEINWDYKKCGLSPTMSGLPENKIIYSVSLSSPGNSPGYSEIEFYVDTEISATCDYDSEVIIRGEGFSLNQQNSLAVNDAMDTLANEFSCKFFSDPSRQNQIQARVEYFAIFKILFYHNF